MSAYVSPKRSRITALVTVAVVAVAAFAPSATAHNAKNKALRRQVNAFRDDHSKQSLKMSIALRKKAHAHAKRMMADGRFNPCETGPGCDHSTASQLSSYLNAGNCSQLAENIAWTGETGTHTVANIVQQWADSELGHRENMLAKRWKKIGPGVHVDGDGNLWAVALFCKPR